MILAIVKNAILDPNLVINYRVSEKHFTRVRKQTFSTTLLFMMNFLCKSLSLEIEDFVKHVRSVIGLVSFPNFSKSAFVQCRNKIQPGVFKHLSNKLVDEFYADNEGSIKLRYGFRLLAVDGSKITLPDTPELENLYGRTKNQSGTGVVQARASVLYDVLNRFVIDGELSPPSTGEGKLALGHLGSSNAGDLIVYDRGYPSFSLMYEHHKRGINFLMRIKATFSNVTLGFFESGQNDSVVKFYPGKNTLSPETPYTKNTHIKVRLVRVELPSGETEILATSLLDTGKYPTEIFKDLYFLRWGVETFYDELKNKIKAEYFSGYSQLSIKQDFYAALFVSNVQSLIVGEINDELANESNGNKYQYKTNNNLSYGFMKDRIVTLFFSDKEISVITTELKALFKKHTVPIRPNRKLKRDVDKYRKRTKPKVLTNNKNAL